jgi:hypothetical protein
LVMDAECCEPAGSWHALDSRRPPHTRPDQGPAGCKVHTLARADAQYGMHARLDEEGARRVGTQAPIGHAYLPWWSARMDCRHPGQIVGEEGRDHALQEHPRARMEQPQQARHGNAAPQPLLCWLAERVL